MIQQARPSCRAPNTFRQKNSMRRLVLRGAPRQKPWFCAAVIIAVVCCLFYVIGAFRGDEPYCRADDGGKGDWPRRCCRCSSFRQPTSAADVYCVQASSPAAWVVSLACGVVYCLSMAA
ncbi:hypothetical protein KCP77_19390 [Salmonella enterica subsp. enterica]|nr:hypothetical protein KCP77_19390 [Salmonella enterica subsp. enterica]